MSSEPNDAATSLVDADPDSWTLVHAVRAQAETRPAAPFLSFEDGGDLTYGDLDAASDRVATALEDLGVGPEDRVLALVLNGRAFTVLLLAAQKRRAVFVPINTELKGSFLQHQLQNSQPTVVVVDASLADQFDHVDAGGVDVEAVVVVDDIGAATAGTDPANRLASGFLPAAPRHDYADLEATEARSAASLLPEAHEVCTIMYTSGTTGPSKGVLMPHAHCYQFARGTVDAMQLTAEDRYYVCMPMFHANGLFMQVVPTLLVGASAHVVKRFSVSRWLDDVIDQQATVTNTLGVMPELLYRSAPTDRDRSHRLRTIMAIPVAEEWGEALQERYGVRIVQGYGMTEINMVTFSRLGEATEPGCAGYVLDDHYELIVADPETDRALEPGRVGEIMVRPKSPFCFNVGYFGMADKTVEAWRNLWFHTGDAGRFDERGRLYFVDRIRDRIRRRGENISSYEVEQVLNDFPSVVESAAVGLKVEGAGGEEEIKVILAVEGPAPDPVELLDWCAKRMPRFTVPRYVEFVGELEKTASGKIRKQALRDAGVTEATWDREAAGYVVSREGRVTKRDT